MNLAQVLHARWAANAELDRLLPATAVMTGLNIAGDPATRYASVTLRGGGVESYANDGSSVDQVRVRIDVYDDDYDHGRTVADAVLAAFDRSDFALANGARVISMQKAGIPQEVQDPQSGRWSWPIDFHCRVSLPAGA
jgi:hypothetical protein